MNVGWSQGSFHEGTVGLELDLKDQLRRDVGKQQEKSKSRSKDSDPQTGTEDFVGQLHCWRNVKISHSKEFQTK